MATENKAIIPNIRTAAIDLWLTLLKRGENSVAQIVLDEINKRNLRRDWPTINDKISALEL